MPSIIIPDKGPEPVEIDEADYEGVIGLLREEGRPFEIAAETGATLTAEEWALQDDGSEAGRVPLDEAVFVQTEIEGIDPSASFYGEPSEAARLEEKEGAYRPEMEGMGYDAATLEKKVRRAANSALVPGPEFLPGSGPESGALLGLDPGPTPQSPDTYKHFEPPIRLAIEASTDPDDIEEMETFGKDSSGYQAFAGQLWKTVRGVHEKHGLPVVRVEKLGDSDTRWSGIAGAMGSATRVAAPIMLGFDQMSFATAGKQAMGAAAGEFTQTPAIAELEKMGVISDQVGRLEETAEDSPWLQTLGGAISLANPAGLPGLIEKGIRKGAGALGLGGATSLAGKAAGAAGAGAAGTGVELGAEALVETGVEAVGGREATLPTEDEAIEMMLMGAGMGVGGSLIGAGARKYQDYLRAPDTAGGPELNQMEALLSAAEGKPVRGTSMTKPRGLDPGETVLEQKAKVAGQRRTRQDGGPGYAEEVEDIYIDPVKKLVKQMEAKETALVTRIAEEADAYHMSPEGLEQVSTAPILARLEAIKTAKGGTVVDIELGRTMTPGEAPVGKELPLIKTDKLNSIIKQFKGKPTMDARELDASLQEVDDIMASNKAAISANRVYRDLSKSMRDVRDEFMGNVHTKGGSWSDLKAKQSKELQGLTASKDKMGLRNVKMADMDLPTQRATAINAVKSLGKNSSSADIYRILDDNPKLKAELQRVIANEPHTALMRGGGSSAPIRETEQVRAAAGQLKYRVDPIAQLLEGGLHDRAASVGQLGATGTGSEHALAISGQLEASKDALMRMMGVLKQEAKDTQAEEQRR